MAAKLRLQLPANPLLGCRLVPPSFEHIAGLPEQGQLVTVRRRRFVVTDVAESALTRHSQQPADHASTSSPSHASRTTRWERTPGCLADRAWRPSARDGRLTPTDFDEPDRLDAFLDAVRWGAASSADVRALQAPFRSGRPPNQHMSRGDFQLPPRCLPDKGRR